MVIINKQRKNMKYFLIEREGLGIIDISVR